MKYSESQGQPPFDWNEFLQKEHITNLEYFEARKLARNWVTCACGNLCASIPRIPAEKNDGIPGQPVDHELAILGQLFYNSITFASTSNLRSQRDSRFKLSQLRMEKKHKDHARDTLKQIEERSIFLLQNQTTTP